MKTTILTLAGLFILVFLLSLIAKIFISKLFKEIDDKQLEMEEMDEHIWTIPSQKENEDNIILQVRNDSSTMKPTYKRRDYNDIQNLNEKYNKNTYRALNGRFKSLKSEV